MFGLELVVFLVKIVKVMLIMNLWLYVGFCNGVIGIVCYIIYDNGYCLLNLFFVVIVEFDNYRGFVFIDLYFLCVFICFVIVLL